MAEFSYFDQFDNMEIDLSPYLESISTPSFKYTLSNIQPLKTTVKNLFTKQEIIINYKNNIDFIERYEVVGDEFMETVADKKFGSAEYWWVIAVFNDIREPFKQWPLTQTQLVTMAKNLFEYERAYSYETYLKFLTENNDKKRNIILPKNQTLKDVIWSYRQAILEG